MELIFTFFGFGIKILPHTQKIIIIPAEKHFKWLKLLKLNNKYFGLLIAFFMTLALDTTMTFTMTTINVGWTEDFLQKFVNAWIIGFIVAFPTSLVVIPLARWVASKIVEQD